MGNLGLAIEAGMIYYLQDSERLLVAIPLKKMSFLSQTSLTDYQS